MSWRSRTSDQNRCIIHEDSNLDNGVVYTRLVYAAHLPKNKEISVTLNPEEHIDYRWISVLNDLDGEKIVPYLVDILKKE